MRPCGQLVETQGVKKKLAFYILQSPPKWNLYFESRKFVILGLTIPFNCGIFFT